MLPIVTRILQTLTEIFFELVLVPCLSLWSSSCTKIVGQARRTLLSFFGSLRLSFASLWATWLPSLKLCLTVGSFGWSIVHLHSIIKFWKLEVSSNKTLIASVQSISISGVVLLKSSSTLRPSRSDSNSACCLGLLLISNNPITFVVS